MSTTLTPSAQTNPPETDGPRPVAADTAMSVARGGAVSASSMGNLQKIGGIAALIGASTNLVAIVMFAAFWPPKATVPTTQARSWLFLRTTRH